MRITSSSTISHQPTFRNRGFSSSLTELDQSSTLITPDYSGIIPAMDRRRMSEVLKMGIACSVDCLSQAGLEQPDAIIVGTSMGCCTHSRAFMDKIFSANGGLLSPTSFILSTHNTIAGQISLHLKNHGYNITHTQNSLSFEHALVDAMLCEVDGLKNILVGAADEMEDRMFNMFVRLNLESICSTSGASFFTLSTEKTEKPSVSLIDVECYGQIETIGPFVTDFLRLNNCSREDIDLVLFSNSNQTTSDELCLIFGPKKLFDFQHISGVWFTNSAFAMGYGVDILWRKNHQVVEKNVNTILVCNNLVPENLGLILLGNKNI